MEEVGLETAREKWIQKQGQGDRDGVMKGGDNVVWAREKEVWRGAEMNVRRQGRRGVQRKESAEGTDGESEAWSERVASKENGRRVWGKGEGVKDWNP